MHLSSSILRNFMMQTLVDVIIPTYTSNSERHVQLSCFCLEGPDQFELILFYKKKKYPCLMIFFVFLLENWLKIQSKIIWSKQTAFKKKMFFSIQKDTCNSRTFALRVQTRVQTDLNWFSKFSTHKILLKYEKTIFFNKNITQKCIKASCCTDKYGSTLISSCPKWYITPAISMKITLVKS